MKQFIYEEHLKILTLVNTESIYSYVILVFGLKQINLHSNILVQNILNYIPEIISFDHILQILCD